jgi:hypothetical protein
VASPPTLRPRPSRICRICGLQRATAATNLMSRPDSRQRSLLLLPNDTPTKAMATGTAVTSSKWIVQGIGGQQASSPPIGRQRLDMVAQLKARVVHVVYTRYRLAPASTFLTAHMRTYTSSRGCIGCACAVHHAHTDHMYSLIVRCNARRPYSLTSK